MGRRRVRLILARRAVVSNDRELEKHVRKAHRADSTVRCTSSSPDEMGSSFELLRSGVVCKEAVALMNHAYARGGQRTSADSGSVLISGLERGFR